ncbi:MAG: tetratricopeptide repeat protein [Ktedonobacteraceae bacterium]|nr:tetratricopeptide repeat protein [Ktedonobacteraceae bacterium]
MAEWQNGDARAHSSEAGTLASAGFRWTPLSTKLVLPRIHPSLITRESLLVRLDACFDYALTLLVAPAGFGKTTLVRNWAAARRQDDEQKIVAWISLDAGDNDPLRFWRYVAAACQHFDPALSAAILAELQLPQRLFSPADESRFEYMLTRLINGLTELRSHAVLILDDYHTITSPQIHKSVSFFLTHLPANVHVMVLSRNRPPFSLAHLRAHGDVLEVNAADLCFTLEETRAFLLQALPFAPTEEMIQRLQARTGGWIAGLKLIALAWQGRAKAADGTELPAELFGTPHAGYRPLQSYLVHDVLASQPEHVQIFLLQTSILSRLTGDLCDAVTEGSGGDALLAQLEQEGLFLEALDETGQWYHYHALFAEVMQQEARRHLGEEALRACATRASAWYEQQGMPAEAIEAALQARDNARAAALIEQLCKPLGARYEHGTLRRWLEQLPEAVLQERPALCFLYAIALLFTQDRYAPATRERLEVFLQMAEQRWRSEGKQRELGIVYAFRSVIAWWQQDYAESFAAAKQALALLSEEDLAFRGMSLMHLAMEEIFAGKLTAARQAITQVRMLSSASGYYHLMAAATLSLGNICVEQGELHQAAQIYQQVLADVSERVNMLDDRAYALLGLAALYYEWNDLKTARQYVSEALAISEQVKIEDLQVRAALMMARVLQASGEGAQARQHLHRLIARTKKQRFLRELLHEQARLALRQGNLAAARRWAAARTQYGEENRRLQQSQEALLLARLALAQHDIQSAYTLLQELLPEAREMGQTRIELETLLLTALACQQSDPAQARKTLLQALQLAQPEEYQRLFLDEGEAVIALLRTVLSEIRDEPLFSYVRTLLTVASDADAHGATGAHADAASLSPGTELLTPQERRVLRLLAAGRSRPEIARELVVSVNTVRTQVKHIYRKLNVSSRKEAYDAARRLRLL